MPDPHPPPPTTTLTEVAAEEAEEEEEAEAEAERGIVPPGKRMATWSPSTRGGGLRLGSPEGAVRDRGACVWGETPSLSHPPD